MSAKEKPTPLTGEFEVSCLLCGGNGNVEVKLGHWRECEDCRGRGAVVTEMGQKVLDFVWRHFDGITTIG